MSIFADNNLERRKEQGVFTKVRIPKDTIILEFKGDIFDADDIADDLSEEDDYYLQIGKSIYLGPSGWLDDMINHSCQPNCRVHIVGHRAFLISLYEIKPGTQITYDYSTTSTASQEDWSMNCKCASYHCRKIISGYSSLDDATKQKYEELGMIPIYVKENK